MRKYVVGMLIGSMLSFTLGVQAEVINTIKNIIGQTVQGQFPVTVNGVKLDEPAAVIKVGLDDKGYLPIRAIGDSLGVDITFDSNLGIFINGKPKTVGDTVYQPTSSLTGSSTDVQTNPVTMQKYTPQQLDFKIEQRKIDIQALKMGIESGVSSDPNVAEFKTRLAKYEAELAELERQKAALQQ